MTSKAWLVNPSKEGFILMFFIEISKIYITIFLWSNIITAVRSAYA